MAQRGFQILEGKLNFQKPFLKKFLKEESWIKNILEIGFNAGHSADFMLSQRSDILVTSIDIAKHQYTVPCANFLSEKHSDRLKFMIGDSRYTLGEINDKFDFIFIDGGHFGDIPRQDMINCKRLSHDKTIIMLDDYQTSHPYQINVKKCFDELHDEGFVEPIGLPHRGGRDGWILYKYV